MNKSESIQELSKALAEANKKVSNPQKNATNPHFRNKYATLNAVIESYKESYLSSGISVLENPVTENNLVGVQVTLLHESRQYITHDPFMLPPGKDNAQGYGSSITYARRYALSAVMNIAADDDDDGNNASGDNTNKPKPNKASDKQLTFVNKLLKGKVTPTFSQQQAYELLKKRINTTNEIENFTAAEANAAIKFLSPKEG